MQKLQCSYARCSAKAKPLIDYPKAKQIARESLSNHTTIKKNSPPKFFSISIKQENPKFVKGNSQDVIVMEICRF